MSGGVVKRETETVKRRWGDRDDWDDGEERLGDLGTKGLREKDSWGFNGETETEELK